MDDDQAKRAILRDVYSKHWSEAGTSPVRQPQHTLAKSYFGDSLNASPRGGDLSDETSSQAHALPNSVSLGPLARFPSFWLGSPKEQLQSISSVNSFDPMRAREISNGISPEEASQE